MAMLGLQWGNDEEDDVDVIPFGDCNPMHG